MWLRAKSRPIAETFTEVGCEGYFQADPVDSERASVFTYVVGEFLMADLFVTSAVAVAVKHAHH